MVNGAESVAGGFCLALGKELRLEPNIREFGYGTTAFGGFVGEGEGLSKTALAYFTYLGGVVEKGSKCRQESRPSPEVHQHPISKKVSDISAFWGRPKGQSW